MVWHGFVQFIFYLSIIRSPTSSHQGPADWSGWPHDAGEVQDVDGPVQFMGKCCVFFMGNKWRMTVDPWMLYSMVSNPRVNRNSKRLRFSTEKRILGDQRPAIFWGSGKKLQPRTTSEEASGFGAGDLLDESLKIQRFLPATILGKTLSWWLLIHMFHNWIVELNIIL
jgi:hypothetical protein